MQLLPLSTPNVSSSKFQAESASFAKKASGNPCVSWSEDRNGEKGVLYRFWDGLQWAFYGDSPIIDKSYSDIIHSNKSLILKDNSPMVVYGRNEGEYKVCIATLQNDIWTVSKTTINKSIKWIGVHYFGHPYEYSSSSSSSLDSSSSSSSLVTSSSSSLLESSSSSSADSTSSSSFFLSSSSSTNLHSQSSDSSSSTNAYSLSSDSSSIDSPSTSSSSSYLDENIRIVIIDEDNNTHVYGYDGSLVLLSSIDIGAWESVKTTNCGRHIGIAKILSGRISINFYDILTGTWASPVMQIVTETQQCLSFDICGDWKEDEGVCFIVWNEDSGLKLAKVMSSGTQSPYFESYAISTFDAGLTSGLFSFNTIGNVAITGGTEFVAILLGGSQNTVFKVYPNSIHKYITDIVGQPIRYNPSGLQIFVEQNSLQYGFIAQSDVYFVQGVIDSTPIPYSPPELTILNSQRYKYGIFHPDENIIDFMEHACTWDNRAGDMLLESTRRVVVTADEGEDPFCGTSSSQTSVFTETLDTSFSDIDDLICNIQVAARGGIRGYYKEFITQPYELGCVIRYKFKTYWIKDRLVITFYDEFGAVLGVEDTGCIATYSEGGIPIGNGWKEGSLFIPLNTAKTTVQVFGGCDAGQAAEGTAWVLLTECECESSSSSAIDLRCLLTWRLRYDCDSGWTIRKDINPDATYASEELCPVCSRSCAIYDPSIIVNEWIEVANEPTYVEWIASKWGDWCLEYDPVVNPSTSSMSTSSSSSLDSSSESSPLESLSSLSSDLYNDDIPCWGFLGSLFDTYPRPLPPTPTHLVCYSSSSPSDSSPSSDSSDSSDSSPSSDSSISETTVVPTIIP